MNYARTNVESQTGNHNLISIKSPWIALRRRDITFVDRFLLFVVLILRFGFLLSLFPSFSFSLSVFRSSNLNAKPKMKINNAMTRLTIPPYVFFETVFHSMFSHETNEKKDKKHRTKTKTRKRKRNWTAATCRSCGFPPSSSYLFLMHFSSFENKQNVGRKK